MNVLIFNSVSENIKRVINKKCGLNLSQTRLLLFFDHHQNETLTMGELAQELSISLSTLSRQIKQKKTASLIKVERSKKDSSKSLNLNNEGLAKAQELKKVLSQIEAQIFSSWSEEKYRILIANYKLLLIILQPMKHKSLIMFKKHLIL